jgi:hypothetical protein
MTATPAGQVFTTITRVLQKCLLLLSQIQGCQSSSGFWQRTEGRYNYFRRGPNSGWLRDFFFFLQYWGFSSEPPTCYQLSHATNPTEQWTDSKTMKEKECNTGHVKGRVMAGRGGKWRGQRRVSMVEVLSVQERKWNTETCWSHFKKRGEGRGKIMEGMNHKNVTIKPPV